MSEPMDVVEDPAPAPRRVMKVAKFDGGKSADVAFEPGLTVNDYFGRTEVTAGDDTSIMLNGVEVTGDRVVTEDDITVEDPSDATVLMAALVVARNTDNG